MPVKFKGTSDYKRNFKWMESFRSKSFVPEPEQAARSAGFETVFASDIIEPPLQRKKRVNGPAVSYSVDFYNGGKVVDDDYTLLGQQDKFASNIQYRPRRNGFVTKSREASPPKQQKMEKSQKENRKLKPPPIIDTSKYTKPAKAVTKSDKENKKDVSVQKNSSYAITPATPLAPRGPQNILEPELKAALKDKNLSYMLGDKVLKTKEDITEANEKKITKGFDHAIPAPTPEYVLKYKAGIAPPRESKKKSEYQREFEWKKGFKSSPLLAAQEMLYNDRVGPGRTAIALPKTTEYNSQFKPWSLSDVQARNKPHVIPEEPKKTKKKMQRSKSVGAPASRPAAGSDPVTKQHKIEPDNESHPIPKPEPFHGKLRKFTTEYSSNYKSPAKSSYDMGAWKGADPPQLFPEKKDEKKVDNLKVSNWFAEVVELREKAAEYKKRSMGTHFSREHLVQLLAKQTNFWDTPASSSSSTLSALSLEWGRGSIVDQMRKTKRSSDTKLANDYDSCKATMADSNPDDFDDQSAAFPNKKPAWEESSTDIIERENDDDVSSITPDNRGYKQDDYKHKQEDRGYRKDDHGYRQEDPGYRQEDNLYRQEGRLPTPVFRQEEHPVGKARHHLARTTPSVGGAMLTSPPQPSKTAWSVESDESLDTEEYQRIGRAYQLRKLTLSPTSGLPSHDTHALRDDYAASDQPMRTRFVDSPVKELSDESLGEYDNYPSRKKPRERPHFVPPTINEQMGQTYNKPMNLLDQAAEKDDDILSVSAQSIASSCSRMSDLYERSKQRRDNFWSKGVATR